MKIRSGFVSNSSSSSFIVIGYDGRMEIPYYMSGKITLPLKRGCQEFGWDNVVYSSVADRINFAYFQARDVKRDDWMKMLFESIKTHTDVDEIFIDDEERHPRFYNGYIDHQSSSVEGANIEMFDSEKDLAHFLFDSGSYIQGGNDNES